MSGRIKVAFVVHQMQVAGAEMLVAELCRRLSDRIDPCVWCLDAEGQLGAELAREGVPVVVIGRKPGIDVSTGLRLGREMRKRRTAVVHAHQYTPFFYSAIGRVAAGLRPRLIITEHGRHYPDVVSPKRRALNRAVFAPLANYSTGVCEFSVRGLVENDGFKGRPVEVIENGIDLERYDDVGRSRDEWLTGLGLDPSNLYVTCVARFHPVKDHETLIRAFALAAPKVPRARLLLVGGGDRRTVLEALARELGVDQRVVFLGIRRDVPEVLHASDVFALSSVSEAASITLLEAMACRLPSVLTGVGGNPEIVREGQEGLLVPRGDAAAMGRALVTVLNDANLRERMGRAARARVEERYLLSRTVERYGRLFETLAGAA
jgi:glycosyltransferase involved in cell wall biosynthesis